MILGPNNQPLSLGPPPDPSDPNPHHLSGEQLEANKRMVNEVVDKMLKKEYSATVPEDELTQMIRIRDAARQQVKILITPIVEAMQEDNSLWREEGQAMLQIQLTKHFLETRIREFSRDELLWLLAFAYADRMREDFV